MSKAKAKKGPGDLNKTPELLSMAVDGDEFVLDGRTFLFEESNKLCWLTEVQATGSFGEVNEHNYGKYYKHVRTIDQKDQAIPGFAAHELLDLIRIIALKRYIIV